MKQCIHTQETNIPDKIICTNTEKVLTFGPISRETCTRCAFNTNTLKPEGLGDKTARVLKSIKIKKKRGCGCTARQETLNNIFNRSPHSTPVGVTKWAVGVSTSKRVRSVLHKTLEGLYKNGWEPVVFAEPGSERVQGPLWIERPETIAPLYFDTLSKSGGFGAYQNFIQILADLLEYSPDAEAIMYVQDDCIFAEAVKQLLERDLWPSQNTGIVSPYTPNQKGYRSADIGIKRCNHKYLIAGQTLVFPRYVVEQILEHPLTASWKGRAIGSEKVPYKRRALDAFAGTVTKKLGLKNYFYNPSLVEHYEPADLRGKNSTLNHGPHVTFRRSHNFVGEDSNANKLQPYGWVRYQLPSKEQRFPRKPKYSSQEILVAIPFVDRPDLTLKCLEHLRRSRLKHKEKLKVFLIDNGSNYLQVKEVYRYSEKYFKTNIQYNSQNLGFTKAINQAIEESNNQHILILNNDCFVSRDCITKLVMHLEWHPQTAATSPCTTDRGILSLRKEDNLIESGLEHYKGLSIEEIQKQLRRVRVHPKSYLPWSCCLLHANMVAQIGLLPEILDTGLAVDNWWAEQAKKRGYRLLQCYDAFAHHTHSATFKSLNINRNKKLKQATAQLRRLLK
jgi:GT2 family glycosyltransferase